MFDPTLASNVCGSFLGGDRFTALENFIEDPNTNVLSTTHTQTATRMAIEELKRNPTNAETWASLSFYVKGHRIYQDQQDDLEQLLMSFDMASLARKNLTAAQIAARVMGEQANCLTNPDHRDRFRGNLTGFAQNVQQRLTDNPSDFPDEERRGIFAQIFDTALRISTHFNDPFASSRDFSSLMIRLFQICPAILEVMGERLFGMVADLPASHLNGIWPMILEVRARR